MSGRFYTISVEDIAVSALQDLLSISATANMAFKFWRLELGQRTLTAWEAKPLVIKRFPATVTAGTGGAAVTPRKMNNGDSAATVTARRNDITTQMTSSGTVETMLSRDWEFLNGFIWVPMPDERPVIAPSQGMSIGLPTAPSGSMNVNLFAVVEELF